MQRRANAHGDMAVERVAAAAHAADAKHAAKTEAPAADPCLLLVACRAQTQRSAKLDALRAKR